MFCVDKVYPDIACCVRRVWRVAYVVYGVLHMPECCRKRMGKDGTAGYMANFREMCRPFLWRRLFGKRRRNRFVATSGIFPGAMLGL